MWGDFFAGLGQLGNFLGGASQVVSPLLNFFGGGGGGGGYSGGGGGGGVSAEAYAQWQAEMAAWKEMMAQAMMPPEMPDMGLWMEGLMGPMNEMMGQQQGLMQEQRLAMENEQKKGLARQAASARKGLQERGIAYDPMSGDTGAAGSAAIASMLGLNPEELRGALDQFGEEFGWRG